MLLLSRKPKFPGGKSPDLLGSSQCKKRGRAAFPSRERKIVSRRRENLAFGPEFQYATKLQMLDRAQVKNGSMQD